MPVLPENVLITAPVPPTWSGSTVSTRLPGATPVLEMITALLLRGDFTLGLWPTSWIQPLMVTGGTPAGMTVPSARAHAPSPSAPRQPPVPGSGIAGSGATSSALLLTSLAALLVLFSAAWRRFTRRLDEVSASWRPMPFVSLLERPG
jgi:hypothetical protein